MHNNLWSLFAVLGAVMGFLMGYATAPMIESGLMSGQGGKAATQVETRKAIEQYYKDLYKEE
ncbi:MAG: hypothetical protein EPN19_07205 [Betaproteobacteria bacterium]|nr:MAG: hypothetical protein EPN19_07205 [Betaproteobacteria bacterium]